MSSLTVRIPESLHNGLREISKREGVSINQYIALAVTEKMSVINTMDAISERKKEGRNIRCIVEGEIKTSFTK